MERRQSGAQSRSDPGLAAMVINTAIDKQRRLS